jgi:hypothetical protein
MSPLSCTKCSAEIPSGVEASSFLHTCDQCGSRYSIEVFPALHRSRPSASAGGRIVEDTEASCFYHERRRAVVACEGCGRFLCALCDMDHGGAHYCPSCLEVGRRQGEFHTLESSRMRYDRLAMNLAIVPLLLWPLTCLTAPTALYLVIRYWRQPVSVVPSRKLGFAVAGAFAILEIIAWTVTLASLLLVELR